VKTTTLPSLKTDRPVPQNTASKLVSSIALWFPSKERNI
jgi:hypothetical protein